MKFSKKSILGILLLMVFSITVSARDYYQIKVYTIKNATQEATVDKYLKDAFIPAMHRAGVKDIGVFKPIADDPAVGTKIFVFIPLKNLGDFEKLNDKLESDKKYQTAGADYINAKYDNPPYERIESILIKAFSKQPSYFVPKHATPRSEQIYELRSYEGATEKIWKKKVEMFDEAGEMEVFQALKFNEVFYGEVISGSRMPNLMYMTSFKDMKTHDDLWGAFGSHPIWVKLKDMEEFKNTVSHIDKYLMHPTDYSDI